MVQHRTDSLTFPPYPDKILGRWVIPDY